MINQTKILSSLGLVLSLTMLLGCQTTSGDSESPSSTLEHESTVIAEINGALRDVRWTSVTQETNDEFRIALKNNWKKTCEVLVIEGGDINNARNMIINTKTESDKIYVYIDIHNGQLNVKIQGDIVDNGGISIKSIELVDADPKYDTPEVRKFLDDILGSVLHEKYYAGRNLALNSSFYPVRDLVKVTNFTRELARQGLGIDVDVKILLNDIRFRGKTKPEFGELLVFFGNLTIKMTGKRGELVTNSDSLVLVDPRSGLVHAGYEKNRTRNTRSGEENEQFKRMRCSIESSMPPVKNVSPPTIDTGPKPFSRSQLEKAKSECQALGFKPATEKFGECVLKLSE